MTARMLAVAAIVLSLTARVDAQSKAPAARAKAPTAVITMEKGGAIVLELFPDDAPKHVENFITLARQGFYDGQRFHRIEDWVAQVGDPQTKTLPMDDDRIGTGGAGYTIKAEFNKRHHDRGALGMARGDDPNSASSQFYVTKKASLFLDGQYTVFGRVVKGMDVVDALAVGDRVKSVKVGK